MNIHEGGDSGEHFVFNFHLDLVQFD